jgi:RNA polymerase sigma factor (sigma-70 family)
VIKNIKFKDGIVKYNTKTGDGFDHILGLFDRKIKVMVSHWVGQIPNHDVDDLAQICRMKLVEALEKYDDTLNINFSTYVYTVWHRRLAQLRYQYKTKKYSRNIENDNYVSFNYAMDRINNAFYLMLGKHKCPLTKKVINKNTCHGCPHHVAYKSKEVSKGFDAGKTKKFTLCKYAMGVLEQRGTHTISLDQPIQTDNGEVSLMNALASPVSNEEIFFKMDFDNLKQKVDKKSSKIDKTAFIILQLMVEGMSRNEILKKIRITNSEFEKKVKSLISSPDVKNLID